MDIDQAIMLSRIFLGLMIFFLITAGVVFFIFDIGRAWRILTGKKIPFKKANKQIKSSATQRITTHDLLEEQIKTMEMVRQSANTTELLVPKESTANQYKGYDATTVLKTTEETTLLCRTQEDNDNEGNIVLDITFIHTEIAL